MPNQQLLELTAKSLTPELPVLAEKLLDVGCDPVSVASGAVEDLEHAQVGEPVRFILRAETASETGVEAHCLRVVAGGEQALRPTHQGFDGVAVIDSELLVERHRPVAAPAEAKCFGGDETQAGVLTVGGAQPVVQQKGGRHQHPRGLAGRFPGVVAIELRLPGGDQVAEHGTRAVTGGLAETPKLLANVGVAPQCLVGVDPDQHRLREIVRRVGNDLGLNVRIKAIDNPRKELEEHYYNPKLSGLLELGLKPHPMTDEVVSDMLRSVMRYKERIDVRKIMPRVRWR